MGILKLFRRLLQRGAAKPAPKADDAVRELQKKLMSAARENGRPRIGA